MSYFEKNIIYLDNHLVVAYKPSGMLSQKDRTGDDSILEHVRKFLKEKFQKPGEVFLGSIHRLDRPAEGLMVFAKTSKALTRMNALWKRGEVSKGYYAVVEGVPDKSSGTLVDYIQKDKQHNLVKRFDVPGKDRKMARLHYKVVASKSGFSLLSIKLDTGRPHQIRVQLAGISCPIVGDLKYGARFKTPDQSICLMSKKLRFIHPVAKNPLEFEINMPVSKKYWSLFRTIELIKDS